MKKYRYFWLPVSVVLLLSVLMAGCSSNFYNKTLTRSGDTAAEDYVEMVQNGYLGEYTDITVKDLLGGHYGLLYDKETWDGGTTDSGEEIVEVKYQDSDGDWNDVTIQFTMLDERCFEVSAFVDPLEPLEKNTDIFAALNYIYVEQYTIQNESQVGDLEFELALIERLNQISCSAVLYGAASEYSGDRSQLCALAGNSPVDVSVPLLLDNYGLLDLSYYYPNNFTSSSNEDIIIDTELYTITLPASWEGRYVCEQWDNNLIFYERENYENGWGGTLFSISFQEDDSFRDWPGYFELGALVTRLGENISPLFVGYIVVSYPTDVQFSEDVAIVYTEMSNDIDAVLASFTTQEGYALISD